MRNPTRRNRNIGTGKQGHGANNKLVIPNPYVISRSFHERLCIYDKKEVLINGIMFLFVIEANRVECHHACSVNDIAKILENIPLTDLGELHLIVLRQPKRKEEILSPVWGRSIFSYEFEGVYQPAIILEAVDVNKNITWPKSMKPDDQMEFDRLCKDGHRFVDKGRNFVAPLNLEPVRTTQLYRTLPHEIGHYKHYLKMVEKPGNDEDDFEEWEKLSNDYDTLKKDVKENMLTNMLTSYRISYERLGSFHLNPSNNIKTAPL